MLGVSRDDSRDDLSVTATVAPVTVLSWRAEQAECSRARFRGGSRARHRRNGTDSPNHSIYYKYHMSCLRTERYPDPLPCDGTVPFGGDGADTGPVSERW